MSHALDKLTLTLLVCMGIDGAWAQLPAKSSAGSRQPGLDNAIHTLFSGKTFSQAAISLTATLAWLSSLPMVKKPWNWPGK